MWTKLKPIFKALFGSKKFLALLAGVLVWALSLAGVAIPKESVIEFLGLVGAYIIGQGIADRGKEAVKEIAKAEASAKAAPVVVPDPS